jgi:hypothetical protein
MDFRMQLVAALIVACAIAMTVEIIKKKQYKKERRSIKYLAYKVFIIVMLPIISIPFLLTDVLSPLDKLIVIGLMFLSGLGYLYYVTSARKTFRKILGLPPEDEDTGVVIKEDKKGK